MSVTLRSALLLTATIAVAAPAASITGQGASPRPANRMAYLDRDGVIRWRDDRREVALFGANYVIHTASDYRAAGYVRGDRKKMIDEDMAHFARMGWDGLRLTFWGDWEASDSVGNLVVNDHLDLLDYLIMRARERGIYMLFSPIQLYNAKWPDAMQDSTAPGFGRRHDRSQMGTDPAAIAAQANYLRQVLQHVNPYTGVALKDEPGILFIELVNEPVHHPEDLAGSIRYINTLTDAVRSTGFGKPVFYNVSQDFRIGEAIRRSKAEGVSFGWYPTGLNSGHELMGNYLRGADAYPDMLRTELRGMPRIAYEFDAPDLRDGYLYPAMVRTFRTVGAQVALMFAYDMLQTASRNLGWQTHYMNLVYTPRKAVGAIIAAEAMHRLPRFRSYGEYPTNTRFGDFHLAYESDLAELVARDAFMYAGSTTAIPPTVAAIRQIVGHGSSSTVQYDGLGIYFLDKVRAGVWRLEVYPDAVPIRDPFEPQRADKVVTRAISRSWGMTVALPDLGDVFTVQPLAAGNTAPVQAARGRFDVTPGVYILSAAGPVDVTSLPAFVGRVGVAEYHGPPTDSLPLSVHALVPSAIVAGRDARLRARVVDTMPPDSVTLFARPKAGAFYHGYAMHHVGGYDYEATIPATALQTGPHEFVVAAWRGSTPRTFPGPTSQIPWDWNYSGDDAWTFDVVGVSTPLRLFDPGTDAAGMAFTRIGDAGRRGQFRLGLSAATGAQVFHLELPLGQNGAPLADYTASLVVDERITARHENMMAADRLDIRLRGLGARQTVHLTLMEDDGTSWTTAITVDSSWNERSVPLAAFTIGRGVLLPQGFPGEWNYWVGPAAGRGGGSDRLRPDRIGQLQLSLRADNDAGAAPRGYGVEVEWITLQFRDETPGR